MLQKLTIRNYVLIDNLEIDFNAGLNIITGETGAGKSIILGALSLLLGQRADSRYFFNQAKKCIIEGGFQIKNSQIKALFEEYDLDYETETILRREISIDGKSRAFINDSPVNLTTLKKIGEQLIAIHSQHATLELGNKDFQLLIIDSLANHQSLLNLYYDNFRKFKHLEKKLNELNHHYEEAKKKQDYEQYLFEELEQAQLTENEQDELENRLQKLSHAENIKRALNNSTYLLDGEENSTLNLLKKSTNELSAVEKYDKSIAALLQRINSAYIELKDLTNEISSLEENINYNPELIEKTEQRLDLLYSLQKKHRVSSNKELITVKNQLAESLNAILNADEELNNLKIRIDTLHKSLFKQALAITKNRENAIPLAEKQIKTSLADMGMPHAQLKFELEQLSELNIDGINKLNLLFSANQGQKLAPIQKVASGGELSRLMLAIKALLAQHTNLPCLIFDEIDTGISGEIAQKVGKVIANLTKYMQIIAITHLPQIASKGQNHYLVYKIEENNKTNTSIKLLDNNDRIHTIAEMLSGEKPSQAAIENAKVLLGS